MNQYDDRIKLDVFKCETTYQCDYQKFPFQNRCKPQYKIKKIDDPKPKKLPDYQDNETFVRWRPNEIVPFDLLWRPKDIIRTNPYEPFQKPAEPKGADMDAIIKSRPRVYMSPAVGLDDIDDPKIRNLLISHMYTSEWKNAIEETAIRPEERDIPNTTAEKEGDPVRLKLDFLPPLPENFRNKGGKWEGAQLKYTVDPTRTFWKYREPPVKSGAGHDSIEDLVSEETKEQIRELIKQNKLRLPHDIPMSGYSGYTPRLSYGVSLEKRHLPRVHPLLSVNQAKAQPYEPQ